MRTVRVGMVGKGSSVKCSSGRPECNSMLQCTHTWGNVTQHAHCMFHCDVECFHCVTSLLVATLLDITDTVRNLFGVASASFLCEN